MINGECNLNGNVYTMHSKLNDILMKMHAVFTCTNKDIPRVLIKLNSPF